MVCVVWPNHCCNLSPCPEKKRDPGLKKKKMGFRSFGGLSTWVRISLSLFSLSAALPVIFFNQQRTVGKAGEGFRKEILNMLDMGFLTLQRM